MEETCPSCLKPFLTIDPNLVDVDLRLAHANFCVEEMLKDPMLRKGYACPVCEADLSSGNSAKRIAHVKDCASKCGIKRIKQLRVKLVPDENVLDRLLNAHERLVERPAKSKITGYFKPAAKNENIKEF